QDVGGKGLQLHARPSTVRLQVGTEDTHNGRGYHAPCRGEPTGGATLAYRVGVCAHERASGDVVRRRVSARVRTVPNVLSLVRLLGVPIFLWAIFNERDVLALVVLMTSGITDYLDGKIARTMGLESRLGQLLDPIADRLYILTTILGLAWRDIIPWWLVAILVAREAFMAGVMLRVRSLGQIGLPVHFVGKAATF